MADRPRRFTAVIVLLALGAGAVDAFSFALLGAVFASVMTGNLVVLGLAVVQVRPGAVVRSAVAIAAYFAGVLGTSAWLRSVRFGEADPWPGRVLAVLAAVPAAQALVLAGWLAQAGHPAPAAKVVLLAVSAFAMGAQSAGVNTLPVTGAATTYLTGTLTRLATELAATGVPVTTRRFAVLGAALAGAALDAILITWARPAAPALPLVAALAALALVARRPGTTS